MQRTSFLPLCVLTLAAASYACAASGAGGSSSGGLGGSTGVTGSGGMVGSGGTGGAGDDAGLSFDGQGDTDPLDPDSACAAAVQEATVEVLPVDIIWMVDNSSSMGPATQEVQAGLNAFAGQIGAKNIDYKVIMLSLRNKMSPIMMNGTRYPVCIPPPLAGDTNCGNGPRFFHSSIDILSEQPLEQFLGTLGQTLGYTPGQARGGDPWAAELRTQATKTIVVVTDDNARLAVTHFEMLVAGPNPESTSLKLPDGILRPSWNGLFDGYVFSGIYGWGSDTDPSLKCTSSIPGFPANSGPTYTTLVQKTGGVRAQICDGASAWQPFFDSVAQAVISTSKLSCVIDIPTPMSGILDKNAVNVQIVEGSTITPVYKVTGASACGAGGGWYYDNDNAPTKIILCPDSCDAANASVGAGKMGRIEVLFGCATILK